MYFNCGLKRSLKCMFLIVLSNLCTNKHASHAINIKYIDLYPSCRRHLPIICRLIVDPRNDQGPVSRKSRELFGPEKPFVKLRTAYSVKADRFICCKGNKNNSCLETPSFWRYKENYVTEKNEIRQKSFGAFEKQALPSWPDSSTCEALHRFAKVRVRIPFRPEFSGLVCYCIYVSLKTCSDSTLHTSVVFQSYVLQPARKISVCSDNVAKTLN